MAFTDTSDKVGIKDIAVWMVLRNVAQLSEQEAADVSVSTAHNEEFVAPSEHIFHHH